MTLSIQDVAQYFISHKRNDQGMSSMKLHKLCFLADTLYQRALYVPLFSEYFTHTKTGPRYTELMSYHKGAYILTTWPVGDTSKLDSKHKEYLDRIFQAYSFHSGPELSRLTQKMEEYTTTDTQVAN